MVGSRGGAQSRSDELGVSRTPTIFVSNSAGVSVNVVRWNEFEGFQELIDRLLEEDVEDGA